MDPLKYTLLLGLIATFNFTAAQEEETIEWTPESRLTWEDFKGRSPRNPRAAATTASGISYQFSTRGTLDNVVVDYTVSTFFYPHKSWYQPQLCDAMILSHEQLHFDISELFARKMRGRMEAATFTHKVKAEVQAIYRAILKELGEFQNLYDKQTNFSRNRQSQLLWNKKIAEALTK